MGRLFSFGGAFRVCYLLTNPIFLGEPCHLFSGGGCFNGGFMFGFRTFLIYDFRYMTFRQPHRLRDVLLPVSGLR